MIKGQEAPVSEIESYGAAQKLDLYWDPNMAQLLETWGLNNTWHEIQMLLCGCQGKILDIACGTGRVIELVQPIFPHLQFYGCDISDFLIEKAIQRGIKKENLEVCDLTATNYADNSFDYGYSIGSLEHFTDEGFDLALKEISRICSKTTFHQIPVSRSGKNEGWIEPYQAYFNNAESWWLTKFKKAYSNVWVLPSLWEDKISVGRWFVCSNNSTLS